MDQLKFLSNLKLDKFYKVILGLSSVILILSLFFETKDIPNKVVQAFSFFGVTYSCFAWLIDETLFQGVKPYDWRYKSRIVQLTLIILFVMMSISFYYWRLAY